MKSHSSLRRVGVAAVVVSAGSLVAVASAVQYHAVDLGTLGGSNVAAWALNQDGVVVGQSAAPDTDFFRGFVWDGSMSELAQAGAGAQNVAFAVNDAAAIAGVSYNLGDIAGQAIVWSGGGSSVLGNFAARDINAAGVVAGAQTLAGAGGFHDTQAVVASGGTTTPLGTLGGSFSAAQALNTSGWVVGTSTDTGGTPRAFLVAGDGMTDLGTLGGAWAQAADLSETGFVVGVSATAGGAAHAFRYTLDADGTVLTRTDLGDLGSGNSHAYGVNSAGQVVGTSDWRAFLWDGANLLDLNTLVLEDGWELTHAVAINDAGLIAGRGRFHGQPRAFLLVPAACGADLDGDGQVDLADLSILLANFGTLSGATHEMGDLNGDGAVDLADLSALLVEYGAPCD